MAISGKRCAILSARVLFGAAQTYDVVADSKSNLAKRRLKAGQVASAGQCIALLEPLFVRNVNVE